MIQVSHLSSSGTLLFLFSKFLYYSCTLWRRIYIAYARRNYLRREMRKVEKRILVVDDEKNIVRLVQVVLEKAGYGVITAFDGEEAMRKVETESPDMLVLDWMMPRMNGMEVLGALQADTRYMNIPVIMLTGKAQDADIFKGWQSGVSSYLTKPFNPKELLVFVERIFQAQDAGEDRGEWTDYASSGTVYEV